MRARLPVRLLALDLDGTVLGPDLEIRPRVLAAVAAARAAGVAVVVATGRMYRSAAPVARALEVDGPVICLQGAYVRDVPGPDGAPGGVLYHRSMPSRVAAEAIAWAREHGLDPHVDVLDRLVMEMGDEGSPDYERDSGMGA